MRPLFDEKLREKAVLPSQEKALERLREKRALFHQMQMARRDNEGKILAGQL